MAFSKAADLLKLAMMAAARQGVTLDDIVDKFGGVHRTAQRMVDALSEVFPDTERRIGEDRRARWHLPSRSIAPLLTPSAEELAALRAAIEGLDRNGFATEAATARQLELKVLALIPPQVGTRLAADEEALLEAQGFAARPGPKPNPNSVVDAAISKALKGPSLLRIAYRKRSEDKPSKRTVAPYGLLLGTRRYLIARDTSKPTSALRYYRVEEIYEADVLDETFRRDDGFQIEAQAAKGFGSFENIKEHGEVVWKFRPDAAAHARRYQFHPTQSFEDQPDGSLVVRFTASGHLEMCWHLYAWGAAVEVVKPEALKKLVARHRRKDFPVLP